MRVEWLRTALANLIDEADFIGRENPAAAERTVTAIHQAIEHLRRFPALGRPGRISGTRELVVTETPYIIPYRVRGCTISTLRVFHASRRWPRRL